jgi:hypothetical protein
MTKIERASQQVNLAIEAVAERARHLSDDARGVIVTHDTLVELRVAIDAWDDATKALLRLYGKPEANAPEEGDDTAPVPA